MTWFLRQLGKAVAETRDWPDWAKREAGLTLHLPNEARTVTFEIPLPPRGCSPNLIGHGHWRGRRDATKEYRTEAFYAVKALAEHPMRTPVRLCATFCVARVAGDGRYRPKDVQNAISSAKALVDGVVDAGLIPDDSARYLRWGQTDIVADGVPGVTVTITEEPEG